MRTLTVEEMAAFVQGKRYSIRMRCICSDEDRGNGWGCCCSWPKVVVEDPEGPLRLIVA